MRTLLTFFPWLLLGLLVVVLAVSWSSGGIAAELVRSDLTAAQRVDRLKAFFQEAGAFAPVAYVVFVIAEVVIAPLPGLMLYAPGGLIFGPWYGGILAVIGNTIGAGISCGLTRSLGSRWLDRFAGHESIEKLQEGLNRRGIWMIFLLRLNPLTSTDLLSYAAGFSRLPVHRVMLATGLGMTPLCLAQSWLSDSLFNRFPQLLWPLLIVGLIYLIVAVIILAKFFRQSPAGTSAEEKKS